MGDWGLGIGPNPQSPIPNPQSPIPKPKIINNFIIYIYYKLMIINILYLIINELIAIAKNINILSFIISFNIFL